MHRLDNLRQPVDHVADGQQLPSMLVLQWHWYNVKLLSYRVAHRVFLAFRVFIYREEQAGPDVYFRRVFNDFAFRGGN